MNDQMGLGLWIDCFDIGPMTYSHRVCYFINTRGSLSSFPWTHYLAVL